MPIRLGLEAGPHTMDVAVTEGVKGVPIGAEKLAREGVKAVLAPLKERGLEVCQIGAFGYNPLTPNADALEKQKGILQQVIPMAADTGCPYIVICGGNYHPSGFGGGDPRNFTQDALDLVAKALSPMVKLAETHGARLSIEAYLKTAVYSPESFLSLWNSVGSDALCVNVDVTSLYDYDDLWDPKETVAHVCTALKDHYGLGHIKEVALLDGFHIHAGLAPLGKGPTDWKQVVGLMAPHMPADSWLILEHAQTAEEAVAGLAHLRAAAKAAGVALA